MTTSRRPWHAGVHPGARRATAAAAAIQQRYAAAVRANRLVIDRRWGHPVLAYNVFIQADQSGASALSAVQDQVLSMEPMLLRMPPTALHATVTFLLPAASEFDRPKDELWQESGPTWLDQLATIAAATAPFRLRFRRVVATDEAIIAVADEPNGVSDLRRQISATLELPGEPRARTVVHSTLFRYGAKLANPHALLAWLAQADADAVFDVGDLLVVCETVFPFLGYDLLRRLPLRPGSLAS